MKSVYQEWAEEMGSISIGAIQHGVKLAIRMQFPPNLSEFMDCCSDYNPPMIHPNVYSIEHKLTPEQIEENKKRVAEIQAYIFSKYRIKK